MFDELNEWKGTIMIYWIGNFIYIYKSVLFFFDDTCITICSMIDKFDDALLWRSSQDDDRIRTSYMFEILQQLRRKEIENTKVKIQFCESRHKEEQYFIVYIYHIFNIFGFVWYISIYDICSERRSINYFTPKYNNIILK